jgi:hypothetical protein
MVFRNMSDSLPVTAPTWTFGLLAYDANQDHPAHIP